MVIANMEHIVSDNTFKKYVWMAGAHLLCAHWGIPKYVYISLNMDTASLDRFDHSEFGKDRNKETNQLNIELEGLKIELEEKERTIAEKDHL